MITLHTIVAGNLEPDETTGNSKLLDAAIASEDAVLSTAGRELERDEQIDLLLVADGRIPELDDKLLIANLSAIQQIAQAKIMAIEVAMRLTEAGINPVILQSITAQLNQQTSTTAQTAETFASNLNQLSKQEYWEYLQKFALKIRTTREERGLSQKKLADAAGVPPNFIGRLESFAWERHTVRKYWTVFRLDESTRFEKLKGIAGALRAYASRL